MILLTCRECRAEFYGNPEDYAFCSWRHRHAWENRQQHRKAIERRKAEEQRLWARRTTKPTEGVSK